jgi:hypothetical protein
MEYLDHPTVYAMALFFAFMIGGSIVQWIFLIRLKRLDWEIWVRAGRPTIWSDRDLIRAWPTIKFLLGKKYLFTGTRVGHRFCSFYRYPLFLGYFGTCLSVIWFLVSLFLNGWPQDLQ